MMYLMGHMVDLRREKKTALVEQEENVKLKRLFI